MMRANRRMMMGVASEQTRETCKSGAMLLCVAILLVVQVGCGSAPRSRYYQLTVPSGAPSVQAPDSKVTLVVGNLSASHLYREEGIVYSLGPEEMGTYQYQLWAEPPTQMIEEVLLRELRTSGRYLGVYPLRSQTSGNFLIHGRLYDFKEVDGGSIVARVSFDMEMRDLKTGATVWTHYYTHDEPVSAKNVPAVVAALDQNVQRGIKEVAASLDQYFASHPVN